MLDVRGTTSPRVDLVEGPCTYLSRAAFDLLGGMDETLPTSACAIADFGLRARERGLANLLAGDLLVLADDAAKLSSEDRDELARHFPVLWQAAQNPPSAAAERSLDVARTASRKLSVTIDARSLGAHAGGTQVYTLELIRCLSRTGEVRIRALVGPDSETAAQLEHLDETSVITYEQALATTGKTDLVHRPQQVFTVDDLELLRPLGRRLVITHLDLIAYHNPTYFAELAQWQRHLRATRIALAAGRSHPVLLLARPARRRAGGPGRHAAYERRGAGIDQSAPSEGPMTQPKALADRDQPFLLCLGTDYAHKNRPFALKFAAELRRAQALARSPRSGGSARRAWLLGRERAART